MLTIVFWASAMVILYTLAGFPILLWLRAKLMPRPYLDELIYPTVSVVVAAYNEELEIAGRIENLLACDYPNEKLEILIASDGSTDTTHELVQNFDNPKVRLLEYTRRGKGQVINETAPQADGEILVFSDANTHFEKDALQKLIGPFADPQVGGVAGNQIYARDKTASLSADGEKSHWAFDTWMKNIQSKGGNVTSATGAIYAIRKDLFTPVPADSMDDFMISTGVVANGKRLVFQADAIAIEPVATRSKVEWKRKIRVITQGLRSVIHRRALLNPFRFGFYAIQLFTHKVLRRALVIPLLLILLTSPFLWTSGFIYQLAVIFQGSIFAAALIGLLLSKFRVRQFKIFAIPYFFLMVNAAALLSIWNTVTGRRIKRWEPERHQQETDSGKPSVSGSSVS